MQSVRASEKPLPVAAFMLQPPRPNQQTLNAAHRAM